MICVPRTQLGGTLLGLEIALEELKVKILELIQGLDLQYWIRKLVDNS